MFKQRVLDALKWRPLDLDYQTWCGRHSVGHEWEVPYYDRVLGEVCRTCRYCDLVEVLPDAPLELT